MVLRSSAGQLTQALHATYPLTKDVIADVLKTVGYGIADITGTLQHTVGCGADDLARTLKTTGYSAAIFPPYSPKKRVEEGFFGSNIHRTGATPRIANWSAGCQVLQRKSNRDKLLRLCGHYRASCQNCYTYTLLRERELA